MKILLIFLAFSLNAYSLEIYCPTSSNEQLVADPAIVKDEGRILVMGTGQTLTWKSHMDMLQKSKPGHLPLNLYKEVNTNGEVTIHPLSPDELPWDLQFYIIDNKKYLYGGLMTPMPGSLNARWPMDNISRRIKVATFDDKLDGWVFKQSPLFGQADHKNWEGHSYGQQIVKDKKNHYVFHEEISSSGITEIFVRKMISPLKAGNAIKIIGISDLEAEASRRLDGGHLLEGPRHQKIKIANQTIDLIYFSTGDFPTKNYTTRVAYSVNGIEGTYYVVKDDDGKSSDLTAGYSLKNKLHGVGRAFPFKYQGQDWILFHGAKDIAGVDHKLWPPTLDHFRRCLFAAPITFKFRKNNQLKAQIEF